LGKSKSKIKIVYSVWQKCMLDYTITMKYKYKLDNKITKNIVKGTPGLTINNGNWIHSTGNSVAACSKCVTSNKCIAVRKVATPLRELACHMGSHSVSCHPAEVTFPPLPQPKLVLD